MDFDTFEYYGIAEKEDEILELSPSVAEGGGQTRQQLIQFYTSNFELLNPQSIKDIQPELAFFGGPFTSNGLKYSIVSPAPPDLWEVLQSKMKIHMKLSSQPARIKIHLICHGFLSNIGAGWMVKMKNEILAVEPLQSIVVLIGWGRGCAKVMDYMQAILNMKMVGIKIGKILVSLYSELEIKPILLGVGHSLGAHLIAEISRTCQPRGVIFSRITGLDPAGTGFENCQHQHLMLSTTDATFVDVIHTDGCATSGSSHFAKTSSHVPEDRFNPVGYFGTMMPLGHLDFYPNGGHDQPGCRNKAKASHSFAHKYFIDSIRGDQKIFETCTKLKYPPSIGQKPTDELVLGDESEKEKMGFHFRHKDEGQFYLNMDQFYNSI